MRNLFETLAAMPVLAVLRGIAPDEAVAVAEALLPHGIAALEIPLNSPEPFASLRLLADRVGAQAAIGAGTVLDPADVARTAEAGGSYVVAPNFSPAVVAATRAAGLVSMPGVFTPTEAFAALAAGADALKLFPGEALGPKTVRGLRAVLPAGVPLVVTGGVGPDTLGDYLAAGAQAVGTGSSLYAPGRSAAEVGAQAARLADAVRRFREGRP